MARRNLPSPLSPSDLPLRLTDVDVVARDDRETAAVIEGEAVAALLDVTADAGRLLDPEDIALEIDHVADLLSALADGSHAPAAGALSVAEQCLRRLALRVEGLRPGARGQARRWVITRAVREALRDYRAAGPRPARVTAIACLG